MRYWFAGKHGLEHALGGAKRTQEVDTVAGSDDGQITGMGAQTDEDERDGLAEAGLAKRGRGRPFYMVGGSLRALAALDIISRDYPLPITYNYRMPPSRPNELRKLIASLDIVASGGSRRQH